MKTIIKSPKKIIVTGASRGLGKMLTQLLSQQGWIVYATVRDLKNVNDSEGIKYFYLDLEKNESIDEVISEIFEKAESIDGIVHCAGKAYLDPADVMTDRERRSVFDVNFFGPVYLTEKALKYMRIAKKGKVVFISSIASLDPWPALGVYSASKSALERVAFEWAVLLKYWGIDVSIVRPNPLPTPMNMLRSSRKEDSPYGDIFCNELRWESIEDACNVIIDILKSDSLKFEYSTGEFSQRTTDMILQNGIYEKLLSEYRANVNEILKKKTC